MTKFTLLVLVLVTLVLLVAGSASASNIIYSDDFTGTSLGPAWQILPGQGGYSVDNGLTYDGMGPLSSPSGWSTTSLSLALPFTGLYWEADVETTYDLSWLLGGGYTGPSVPNQQNSSGAQQFVVGVSFDPVTNADRSALAGSGFAGFTRGVDAWYGSDFLSASSGSQSVSGLLNGADSNINDNIAGGTYWLQFIRDGGTIELNYSTDGVRYVTALDAPLADPQSVFNELVFSGETYLSAGSHSGVDSVVISDTTAPEPGTMALLGVPLLIVGCLRKRRVTSLSHQQK